MSTLQRLTDRGLVKPPRWLTGSVQYETIMGSAAYGVSSDTSEYERLRAELEAAHRDSTLPEGPSARPALNDLLARLRMRSSG